jgi:hypothetical protein
MAEILLVIQGIVGIAGLTYIFRRDRFCGLYFFFLFLYAIPAQIGYYYLSDLSALLVGYFGEPVWYSATVFIILSLLSFWLVFAMFRKRFAAAIPVILLVTRTAPRRAGFYAITAALVVALILAYEIIYLALNYEDISWYTAQDEDFIAARTGYFVFMLFIKLLVGITVTTYVLVRQRAGVLSRSVQLTLLAAILIVFVVGTFRLGNRTDLLAVLLGIVVFETSQVKLSVRRIVKAVPVAVLAFAALSLVELTRYDGGQQELDALTSLLTKDYYAPAHMLFAAMANNFVDPFEVIASNFCNSLILLNYPFLQATITDVFKPGVATRSQGYAFFVLTEGYLFLGFAGVLYNGFVLNLALSFWKKLASTNSGRFNLFLLAVMGCMVANLVRGQTSYFIKYLYMFVLPAVILYCSLAGVGVQARFGPILVRAALIAPPQARQSES